jgi:hypothetical protein
MTKKAIKRPDEVEYIEFKGRENFKEVARFYVDTVRLITNVHDEEFLSLIYQGERLNHIPVGTIFYRYEDRETDEIIIRISNKERFFKRYKEDDE